MFYSQISESFVCWQLTKFLMHRISNKKQVKSCLSFVSPFWVLFLNKTKDYPQTNIAPECECRAIVCVSDMLHYLVSRSGSVCHRCILPVDVCTLPSRGSVFLLLHESDGVGTPARSREAGWSNARYLTSTLRETTYGGRVTFSLRYSVAVCWFSNI